MNNCASHTRSKFLNPPKVSRVDVGPINMNIKHVHGPGCQILER